MITARKVARHKRDGARLKRGGGEVRGESVFMLAGGEVDAGIGQVVGDSPTPEFAAQFAEECQQLLAGLDSELQQIAQWKLEGYTNAEIAQRLGRSERAVERKMQRIRMRWSGDIDASGD